jgi:flavin-dependent dehydrogenase
MKEGGRVVGVSSSLGQIRCRYVIDAAGGQHWLRHKLGLDLQRASPPLTAYYGYCEGTCPERDEAPAIEIEGSGWVWTARVEPGLYHWTRLSLGAPLSKPARAPSVFQHLAQKGKMRAADVTWRIMPHSAGCGYFIVGDAAAVVDPAASHGVLRALMSGMMAAHGILKVVKDGANEEQYASHYRTWLSEWFRRDVEELKTLYHELAPAAEWLTGTRASDRDSARVDVLGC